MTITPSAVMAARSCVRAFIPLVYHALAPDILTARTVKSGPLSERRSPHSQPSRTNGEGGTATALRCRVGDLEPLCSKRQNNQPHQCRRWVVDQRCCADEPCGSMRRLGREP